MLHIPDEEICRDEAVEVVQMRRFNNREECYRYYAKIREIANLNASNILIGGRRRWMFLSL